MAGAAGSGAKGRGPHPSRVSMGLPERAVRRFRLPANSPLPVRDRLPRQCCGVDPAKNESTQCPHEAVSINTALAFIILAQSAMQIAQDRKFSVLECICRLAAAYLINNSTYPLERAWRRSYPSHTVRFRIIAASKTGWSMRGSRGLPEPCMTRDGGRHGTAHDGPDHPEDGHRACRCALVTGLPPGGGSLR